MDAIHSSSGQCDKHALTDFYGWMIQCLLAGLAFTCLIAKRFFEPPYVRRSWLTWWYDTSKQGIGAIVIHMTNVYLAPMFQGDPCTWYIINFLLDSTIGLFIIYIGIRVSQYLAIHKQFGAIMFGEYTAPRSWLYQTCIYVGLMVIVKLITTLFIQLDFWNNVKEMVLSPFANPRLELVMVMLVIPLFVNMLLFWVTDNFLMRNKRKVRPIATNAAAAAGEEETTVFKRVKARYYRALHTNNRPQPRLLLTGGDSSESEHPMMASDEEDDDDELLLDRLQLATATATATMLSETPDHGRMVQRNSVTSFS